ncbi:substrate-binding domain-containing protein [Pedobacter sp. HDW13]|uniref:hybrid sensor histidine kinase/response regulator transcription factor n=1 Tax=Pedobacter sp. HDW13 TaxID=2714940 RepID=UPI00140B8D57|nr:substrate-binding domain-containing protein [Pedobacter sp. HDW13]QIL37983.1 substrate-binding domain-containing protein [Pedobacter sp. HDW13]
MISQIFSNNGIIGKARIRFFIGLLVGIICISACREQSRKEAFTIGFSQCVGSDLWRRTMLEEIKMELSLRPETQLIYADANNNSTKQIEQVREMLDKGIDLLIISPNEARPLTGIVEELYSKGIPVIVIDRKTASAQYTAYVGAENYQIGKMAGAYINTLLGGKGNIIEIMGLPGSSPAIERAKGFSDELKKHTGIKIISQLYGNWLASSTASQLEDQKDNLYAADAIFAHNDVMAASAKAFLKKHNIVKNIKIVGVDALPGPGGGLQMISDKKITASVLYPTGGKEAINIALRILNKESFGKENLLQSLVIDSTSVQLMKLQWARISGQQKDIERQQTLLEDQIRVYDSQRLVLNIIVIMLVLTVIFGGLAFFSLLENRKINKSLEQKNDEILSQRNQLVEASARIEAATEEKLNFFTNISHEFRTPLTLILSPLEDLLKQEKTGTRTAKDLGLIKRNVYRLLKLVNELIDYRKIEHQKFKVYPTNNNVTNFLSEIIDSFQYGANKKNIALNLISAEKNFYAWFDINILDKIIFNLLSNALKFTGPNGRITVAVEHLEDTFFITVTDNGQGMTEEELDHVWDQFYQSDTMESKGSGLGLSLSRELIHLHGGSIGVESKKWQGSTFKLILPIGSPPVTAPSFNKLRVDFAEQINIYANAEDTIKQTINETAFDYIKDQSILIIEDNLELLNYLSDKFSANYEVFSASSGNDGLNQAYEKIPDLIISDVIIPGMSGRELAKKLKTDLRTSHIPIILLTAQGSPEQQIEGIQSMADLYMTKPFHFDYLIANVENLIRNRIILKEHYISDISSGATKKAVINALDKKFLNDFAGFVEHHIGNENLSVDDIAQAIGISRIQLYRKVKALLNSSITDYILYRRLKKAKYMLLNEDYSISEISFMVGISSATYFSTLFKNKYGMSPSEFKKKPI